MRLPPPPRFQSDKTGTEIMLLNLRDITRFYGSRLIFKDISLTICRHTVTLLAGPNGAGKSTLLKIMAGLVHPSSGEIHLVDNDLTGLPPQLGYLGHQTFIYPELTALENLRFWASLHNRALSDANLSDMLTRVELTPFAEEKAKIFSRGMAQRLNLARVFLLCPDILLLDEPGTGLDMRSSVVLHREILRAKNAGAGIVWISHNLEADLPNTDLVAYLENKHLRYYGPVKGFTDAPLPASTPVRMLPDPPTTRSAQGGELC